MYIELQPRPTILHRYVCIIINITERKDVPNQTIAITVQMQARKIPKITRVLGSDWCLSLLTQGTNNKKVNGPQSLDISQQEHPPLKTNLSTREEGGNT
jgi:hypothetical protein